MIGTSPVRLRHFWDEQVDPPKCSAFIPWPCGRPLPENLGTIARIAQLSTASVRVGACAGSPRSGLGQAADCLLYDDPVVALDVGKAPSLDVLISDFFVGFVTPNRSHLERGRPRRVPIVAEIMELVEELQRVTAHL